MAWHTEARAETCKTRETGTRDTQRAELPTVASGEVCRVVWDTRTQTSLTGECRERERELCCDPYNTPAAGGGEVRSKAEMKSKSVVDAPRENAGRAPKNSQAPHFVFRWTLASMTTAPARWPLSPRGSTNQVFTRLVEPSDACERSPCQSKADSARQVRNALRARNAQCQALTAQPHLSRGRCNTSG